MPNRTRSLVDRLQERGLIDRSGFLLFALLGALGIIVAKQQNVPAVWVAVGAVASMFAYAYVVQRSGTGRLQGDQAGDNCYYLGLIYTLASLAYAIFTFDPANTASTIVRGFGIALATTVAGLILRVYFNQMRVDLVEVEQSARLELAEAAGKLKAELSRVTVSMNDFGRQTRQSLEELREDFLRTLNEVQEAATDSIGAAATASTEAVTEQSNQAVAKAKRLSSATEKVIATLEGHAAALGQIEKSSAGIATGLAAMEEAAHTTRSAMDNLSTRTGELERLQRDLNGTATGLSDVVADLLQHLRALDDTTARVDALIATRIEQVRAVPDEVASKAVAGVEAAAEGLKRTLESLGGAQDHLASELVKSAGDSIALANRHNAALEQELARSRENVAKVHSALVDMTAKLADRLEGQMA
jgi:hypothetical protein